MSDDLEIIPDTEGEPERMYYVDQIDLPELRRYVCLDMARMMAVLPEKAVKVAREMESYLMGKGLKAVE